MSGVLQPLANRSPLQQVFLHLAGGDVKHAQAVRCQMQIVLGIAQIAHDGKFQRVHELAQFAGRQSAFIHPHTHHAHFGTAVACDFAQFG